MRPNAKPTIFPATSDAGQFLSEIGLTDRNRVQFVIIGPGDFSLAHQDGERINTSDIDEAAEFYLKVYKELAAA